MNYNEKYWKEYVNDIVDCIGSGYVYDDVDVEKSVDNIINDDGLWETIDNYILDNGLIVEKK